MSKIIFIVLIVCSYTCLAQNEENADKVRHNFNYDSLSAISCLNAPPGLYAVSFQVDKNGNLLDFKSSHDSLIYLNRLFIGAIIKSYLLPQPEQLPEGDYVQHIYFNNILHCNSSMDRNNQFIPVASDSGNTYPININKEIRAILNDQIMSIERSVTAFQSASFGNKRYFLLPIAFINSFNPNRKQNKPHSNDFTEEVLTKEEIEKLELRIRERRNQEH